MVLVLSLWNSLVYFSIEVCIFLEGDHIIALIRGVANFVNTLKRRGEAPGPRVLTMFFAPMHLIGSCVWSSAWTIPRRTWKIDHVTDAAGRPAAHGAGKRFQQELFRRFQGERGSMWRPSRYMQ